MSLEKLQCFSIAAIITECGSLSSKKLVDDAYICTYTGGKRVEK